MSRRLAFVLGASVLFAPGVARAQENGASAAPQSPVGPAPAYAPEGRAPKPDYRLTDVFFWSSLSLAALHLTDHVVRNNHSYWPFTDQVTAGTLFLGLVPAIYGTSLAIDAGPLYWTIADSVLLAGVAVVHTTLEAPAHVYEPWANGTNLLKTESPFVGGVALGVVGALTASLATHLGLSIRDGLAHGFTWKRKREARALAAGPDLTFGAAPGGVTLGGRF